MGFWKNLKDAVPQKSHARATEVHEAGIISAEATGRTPAELAGMVCPICKATIGAAFAKDRTEYVIIVDGPLSFDEDRIISVCDKCVEHFGFIQD